MKNNNWRKYAFEFLSIFIAVVSAFALNNWNENRRDKLAERKILSEILYGIEKDIVDVELNVIGHEYGMKANQFWRKIITNQSTNTDSLKGYYFNFLRDFISIQNTSGYENLKSRGLELVENDSLRTDIISLYEYDYKTLKSLEEDYFEMQFQSNYFKEINNQIAQKFNYDTKGDIIGMELPLNISEKDKNLLLSYLWKIDANRRFILSYYGQIITKINSLKGKLEAELE